MPWVILVVVALVAVVTGCGRAPHYDSRLVAADSLMQADPDSALAIIEAVNPGSLIDNVNQAYRDLLLTQARYKCYITATSDSAISRALDYYRHHGSEREKLTRAYIYKGAVMEELGHPDSAMLYYKHAEAAAAPDDYFNLGYTNLRIAELYQSHYANDSAVIARMKKAYGYFVKTGDSAYCVTALGTQGCFPKIIGEDSAVVYLEKAINLGERVNSPRRFLYQSKLAGLHFYAGNYNRAKDLAMKIFWKGRELCDENQYYYYAARAYIHLGCLDSARWLMALIPPPVNAVDSMNHFKSLAELSLATHQYDDYGQLNEIAVKIDTRISGEARKSALHQEELKWDFRKHNEHLRSAAKTKLYISIAILLLVCILLATLFMALHIRRKRKYNELKQDTERQLEHLSSLQQNFDRLQIKEQNLKDFITEHTAIMRDVIEACYHDPRNRLSDQVKKIVQYQKENKQMWTRLYDYIDMEYNGIMKHTLQNYPQLNEKEVLLIALTCLGYSYAEIAIILGYNNATTISGYKQRVAKKMGLSCSLNNYIERFMREKSSELSSQAN